jgi:hypothetical protein
VDTQFAIARMVTLASTGSAMAASLVRPYLPDHTNFAISGHWALFNGQNALGFSGLMRLSGNLVFSAGVAFGLDRGNLTTLADRTQTQFGTSIPQQSWSDVRVLGRVGLMYSWRRQMRLPFDLTHTDNARSVCSLPPCGGGLGRGVEVVALGAPNDHPHP